MLSLLWDIYTYMYCATADDEVYRLYIYIYINICICTDADEKNSVSMTCCTYIYIRMGLKSLRFSSHTTWYPLSL